jgi:hypothetical protein
MTNKAPAGGMASAVNGQWYEGGEFMPDHGKCCGKGRNRITVVEFEAVAAKVAAAGKVLVYNDATGEFAVKYTTGNILYRARSLATIAKCF